MGSVHLLRWTLMAVLAATLMFTAIACGSTEVPAPPTPVPVDVAAIVQQAMEAQAARGHGGRRD